MYGTVARLKVKAGQWDALKKLSGSWPGNSGGSVPGYIGEALYQLDSNPNDGIMVVFFRDKQAYEANSGNPAMHDFYLQYRALLEADPEWSDGEVAFAGGAFGKL